MALSASKPHMLYTVYTCTIDNYNLTMKKSKKRGEPPFSIICTLYKLLIVSFHIAFGKKKKMKKIH